MNQFNETSKSTTIRNFHLSLAVPTSPIAPSNEFDTTSKELTLNGIKTPEQLCDLVYDYNGSTITLKIQ